MSTHNIGLYEDLTKIICELSSNMHLIMPPTLKKLMGLIAFGACVGGCVHGCVGAWVGHTFLYLL